MREPVVRAATSSHITRGGCVPHTRLPWPTLLLAACQLSSAGRWMGLQSVVELVLGVGAVLLLARDLRRAWLDQLRRPITLLMAALIAALLVGATVGRPHPSPWWLVLPGSVLAWEVGRGWRRAPRCHLWETGVGSLAVSLLLAAVGMGLAPASVAPVLLVAAGGTAAVGAGLLWRSRRREPRPWRIDDVSHYERRFAQRTRT
jgi:hypothetical protein